jgi:hypothetical protein
LVQVAFGFELEYRDKVSRVDQRFVLSPFVRAKIALVRKFAKRNNPFLHRWISLEINDTLSRLRIETAAQWIQKSIKPACGSTYGLKLARKFPGTAITALAKYVSVPRSSSR